MSEEFAGLRLMTLMTMRVTRGVFVGSADADVVEAAIVSEGDGACRHVAGRL